MAYRNLMVASPAHLSTRLEQLVIRTEAGERSFPIEDLSAVLVESQRSTLTAAVLSALAENGTLLYFCDQKHTPNALLLPFAAHSRQLGVARAQQSLTKAGQNRLWQQIVSAKIHNQGECLALCGLHEMAAQLFARQKTVTTGDKENAEAVAAAAYFPALFGAGFTRGAAEDGRNAALNYGYAILRGCMARCLTVYGFQPWLGLHHCSELNQFNLADDMMEPYRPVVDLFVAENLSEEAVLETRLKARLLEVLGQDILSGGQHHSVAYAMERQVQSLRACCEKQRDTLLLPTLLPTAAHHYE